MVIDVGSIWSKRKKRKDINIRFFDIFLSLGRSSVCPYALLFWLNMFLSATRRVRGRLLILFGSLTRRWGRTRRSGIMLLCQKVLQPSVLHLQLGNASFEGSIPLGRLAHAPLQRLLSLLLLHAEAGAGGGVAPPPVFFGRMPGMFLLPEGGGDTVAGNGSAVLGIPDLTVWW